MRREPGRLWLSDEQIETTIEEELHKAALMPPSVDPVVDLERFVEGYLGCPLDQYAALPADVLGVTEFRSKQRPAVFINRSLTASAVDNGEQVRLGRWRATVAHEAAHVIFHRCLFEVHQDQGDLFDANEGVQSVMRCLKRDVGYEARSSDWREVQANKGMAALLMPRGLFRSVAKVEMASLGLGRGQLSAGSAGAAVLTKRLAARFAASRQATGIRLSTLGITSPAGAPSLLVQ